MSYPGESSTIYPGLQAADPTRLSLAHIPMELVLEILDVVFSEAQIIPIDIFGPENRDQFDPANQDGALSRQTKVILRPPPLNTTAAACRLFRHAYERSRPSTWGAHLHLRRAYHVDLERDIFHVRIHRYVHPLEWDHGGDSQLDPLYNVLGGVRRMATSVNYIAWSVNRHGPSYLRHLNPAAAELMVLVPLWGADYDRVTGRWGRALEPRPLISGVILAPPHLQPEASWSSYWRHITLYLDRVRLFFSVRAATPSQRAAWQQTWRLSPLPRVNAYIVDALVLRDPKAWALRTTYRFWWFSIPNFR